jgi:lipopolysaccharide transport system permease protein
LEQLVVDRAVADQTQDEWPEQRRVGALRILWQHRELVGSLTRRDIRSRYKQSVLGIVWALLQPLAMTIVFTIVMSKIAKMPTEGIPAPIFIYVVMLPWTFFQGGLNGGSECLVSNFNLITKIYFPREVFPISSILGKTVDLGLGMLILIPMLIVYHIHVTWMVLLVVPLLLIQVCLMLGVTFLLSSWNLFYRDIRHIMPLLVQVWMYMSPVIYGISQVPKRYMGFYMLNPMASLMGSFRKVVLHGQAPNWHYLGIAAAVSIGFLIVGYRSFKRLEPAFAETI